LCCAGTGNKESISSATRRKVSVKVSSKGCCPRSIREEKDECRAACCTNSPADGIAASCTGACCGKANQAREKEGLKTPVVDSIGAVDIERGPSGNEHIILSISGMTCTGCETKLTRTLGTLQSVTNLKTSLVLARAQFDLDTSKTSVADVTRHLERTTEFKCERITNRGSSINLIRTGSSEEVANGIWPLGVINVAPIGKDTIRVDYDAKVVGARDLVEKGWKQPLQLAPPAGDPSLETGSKHVRRVGYMTLLSAVLTVPVLVLAWAPLPDSEVAYSSASLALATIIQVVIAGPFYPKAMKALIFSRVIEMDLLIVLSTSAAYVFSVVSFGYLLSGHPLSTGEFFETGTLLVTLIMVGRYVAALARQKAVESISIRSLQTSTATLIEKSGVEKDIDSRLLQYGDVFKTLPECRITTDGTVVSGTSEVNESMITGESKPVEKGPGSSVVAGSINGSGVLHIRLTRLPEDNTISTIAAMVDEAKLSKPKIQDIADRVASYFVPVVVVLAVITFVAWVGLGINVRGISGSEATIQAITYAITVLIVSCPCAIGLAVPMVIVIATGIAADRGVIFKTAESIEEAYKTTDVVFDKTGTLTEGKLSVEVVEYVSNDELSDDIESLLLGLLDSNKHPVSVAVAAHLKTKGVAPSPVFGHKSLPAKGVEGTTPAGQVLRAGNSTWLNLSAHPRVQALASQRFTVLCFTINDRLAAIMGLSDSLRSDAVSTVSKLQAAGIGTHILSGDDDGAVKDVAAQLNIPARNIRSRCTPADKRDYVQALVSQGSTPNQSRISLDKRQKRPIVLFIGDGTNDAVALATATIGVHINTSGTDVARSAADVVLVRPRLTSCLTVIGVSKVAIRRIAFNFGWSFVYNLFAVLLAAGAFTRLDARIPPQYAGLGELVSVLPVIGAAVTMRLAKV
jgi:Cu2+-exporting ATPase